MFRTAIPTRTYTLSRGAISGRALHSTPVACKTVTEKVSEAADTVNKKVGEGLASAIERGEKATEMTKQKTSETFNAASQKKNQAAAGAKEAKDDFEKEVKK